MLNSLGTSNPSSGTCASAVPMTHMAASESAAFIGRSKNRCSIVAKQNLPVTATQAQPIDQRAVALDVDLRDVLDQPTPASHQQQQSAPRVVIVLVDLEVLGQVGDPLGQQRDLRLRRSGVGVMQAVLAQNFFFLLGSKRHEISPSIGPRSSDIKARPPRTAARADVVGQFSSQ